MLQKLLFHFFFAIHMCVMRNLSFEYEKTCKFCIEKFSSFNLFISHTIATNKINFVTLLQQNYQDVVLKLGTTNKVSTSSFKK